jgi:uncharacterized coiled-coil DUF342 family protein
VTAVTPSGYRRPATAAEVLAMDNSLRSVVERQVRRVRRRLRGRSLLQSLAMCGSVAFALAALWFLMQPLLFAGVSEAWRWGVPGTLLLLGTLAGVVRGWMRTPNLVAAALALDERFALKERVTTLMTLSPQLSASPVGQALLQDVAPRVEKLQVAAGFPLAPSWRASLMPAGAMLLAVAASFFDPTWSGLRLGALGAPPKAEQKVDAKEVQQQLDNLRKVNHENSNPDAEKSKAMKDLLEEWEKLVNKPVDPSNAEQVRERVAEMRTLEQKMKERAHELKAQAQKNDTLKKLLEKLGQEGKKLKEGPARDFEDALTKGDFHKAKEALDKLSKKLQDQQMSPQQQRDLAEQFKQLQEKIQKVMEKDEKLKQLKKDFDEGRIDKEQLDREREKHKELQELANLLGECKECLGQGAGEAAAALAKMAKQFEEMELTEDELNEILRNMDALSDAADGVAQALEDGDGDGMGGGGPPGGLRPIDPDDPNSKILSQRQKARVNPNSQQRIAGYTAGGNFTKIPAKQVEGAFRQAVQQAPEAIERQNIPEDAADVARGYFKKLGGQK